MRKVFLVFAFLAITLLVSFEIAAQSKLMPRKKPSAAAIRSSVVTTELDRHRLFLQSVTSRYEAVSVNDFTPYFSYGYVWRALKENRDRLSGRARNFTTTQFFAVKKGYEILEKDVLQLFADQQLGVLIEELELNSAQIEEFQRLLSQDLKRKTALLSARSLNAEQFTQRATLLSEATERHILERLFPEQREKFSRQVSLTRDRLVG